MEGLGAWLWNMANLRERAQHFLARFDERRKLVLAKIRALVSEHISVLNCVAEKTPRILAQMTREIRDPRAAKYSATSVCGARFLYFE
jgi:hypothetical protein